MFAKKQDQNNASKTNEDKETTQRNVAISPHNVPVRKPVGTGDSDLTQQQNNTFDNQSCLRERSQTNCSILKEHTEHSAPKRSNSLPSSSIHSINHLRVHVQKPEGVEGKDDGALEISKKKCLKNGNVDSVANGNDSKNHTPCADKTNCQGGHDKKANGYGLRVYCVKTTC